MSHDKFKRGSYVLLRQLDSQGNIATIWGGRVLSATPTEMKVMAIEMVYQKEKWHCVGGFQVVTAPPHRLPYHWGFPRLLAKFEANDTDLEAQPVIEAAFEVHQQAQNEAGEGAGCLISGRILGGGPDWISSRT